MKGAVLAVLCAVALSQGALLVNQNGCPLDSRIEKLLPHPNCNYYYQCVHGHKIEKSCPLGLHFSPESTACDFPIAAKCKGQQNIIPGKPVLKIDPNNENNSIKNVYDNPSQAPAICATENSNGILVAHEICNRFYKCAFGVPVAIRCPGILMYDPRKEQCEWPEIVECGKRELIDYEDDSNDGNWTGDGAGNDDPSQAHAICAMDGSNHVHIAHENCYQYYQCWAGLPVALHCPLGFLFDPSKDYCDWPHKVNCGNRRVSENDGSGTENDNQTENNKGKEEIPAGNNHDDPSQASDICKSANSEGVLVAHENCNQFYICNFGQPVVQICPGILLFDPSRDRCEWPEIVNCGNRIISEANENDNGDNEWNTNLSEGNDENTEDEIPVGNNYADPSQANEICKIDNSENILIAHKNCNQFYICNFGIPVVQTCFGNLLFDPTRDRCEWRDIVKCGNRIIPDEIEIDNGPSNGGAGNNDPSQAEAICAAEGSDHVHVAHENCNQFYQCWAGFPVPLVCPDGFYFNAEVDYCDFPENVDCSKKLISENRNRRIGYGKQLKTNNVDNEEDIPIGNNYDDPSEAKAICEADHSDGILVAHKNCNQFYICNFGIPVVQTCFGNLLFDPTRDRCEWRDIVKCGNRIIPDEIEIDNGPSNGGAGNNDPSQAEAICAAEGSDHVHVAHENCNQFYQCWAGFPVPLECPDGFYFNAEVDYCDFPENVNCSNRLVYHNFDKRIGYIRHLKAKVEGAEEDIPVGNNYDDPSKAASICKADNSEGILIAHENCNQFYICNFGIPLVQTCFGNLLFDPSRDRCEWRDIVKCGNRIVPDEIEIGNGPNNDGAGNDDPTQAAAICAVEGSDNVYVAHENCNQFYQCWAGFPIALKCPAGYYFNAKVDYCDFPENVNCANRIISD